MNVLFFGVVGILLMAIQEFFIIRYYARKSHYTCVNCKALSCPGMICAEKRGGR